MPVTRALDIHAVDGDDNDHNMQKMSGDDHRRVDVTVDVYIGDAIAVLRGSRYDGDF